MKATPPCPDCGAYLDRINRTTYECPDCGTEWIEKR